MQSSLPDPLGSGGRMKGCTLVEFVIARNPDPLPYQPLGPRVECWRSWSIRMSSTCGHSPTSKPRPPASHDHQQSQTIRRALPAGDYAVTVADRIEDAYDPKYGPPTTAPTEGVARRATSCVALIRGC